MNNDQHPGGNTGFIAVDPKPTDFVAGAETGITAAAVLPSGDWRPFYPSNATQLMKSADGKYSYGDTNACVSFAGCQDLETMLNFQIQTGKISDDDHAWLENNGYIDASGRVLLSKRFTAKMSGTDPATGNSLPNVWTSLRHDGVVPEAVWPMPTAAFDALAAQTFPTSQPTQLYWNIYYSAVSQAAIDLGKQFAARFNTQYEWIVYPAAPAAGAQLLADLRVAPLEIATAVCNGWNTEDPIKACGAGTQHATLLGFVEPSGVYDILDHYVPYQKQFAGDYNITYGMRGSIAGSVPATQPTTFHYTFTEHLTYGDATNKPGLHALQQALQFLKSKATGQPYMKPGVFGPFGPQTRIALALFENEHGVVDPQPGQNFGPQNRTAMNAALAAQ